MQTKIACTSYLGEKMGMRRKFTFYETSELVKVLWKEPINMQDYFAKISNVEHADTLVWVLCA